MAERVEVRVYPQSKEGDHETALMRFPDGFGEGGGGGSSSAAFLAVAFDDDGVPEGSPTVFDLNDLSQIDWEEGITVNDEGQLVVPAGAYLLKLNPTWSWAMGTPDTGFAGVQIVGLYDHPDTGPTESWLLTANFHSDFETTGFGDSGFTDEGVINKMGIAALPYDGVIEIRADQSTTPAGSHTLAVPFGVVKL